MTAVTNELISKIANELNAEGIRPTLAAIRKRLGKGSFTTISEGLNIWKQGEQQRQTIIEDVLPAEVIEQMSAFGSRLWATAIEKANKRLANEREELRKASVSVLQQIEEAKELNAILNHELDERDKKIEALESKLHESHKKWEDLRQKLEQARQEHDNFRKKIGEETNRFSQKLIKAESERDEAFKAAKNLREELAKTQGKLEQIQEHNKNLLEKLSR